MSNFLKIGAVLALSYAAPALAEAAPSAQPRLAYAPLDQIEGARFAEVSTGTPQMGGIRKQAALAQDPPVAASGRAAAKAPSAEDLAQLVVELREARRQMAEQQKLIEAQSERLTLLEQKLAGVSQIAQAARDSIPAASANRVAENGGARRIAVGEAPADSDRPPEVAVLGQQGSVVTRKGRASAEFGLEYARADRNRAVFRGVELIESILVGVFDINESRQDVLTASASLRYGVTDRLEIGAKIPFVYRSDKSIVAPIAGSVGNAPAATIDSSADGQGIGDIELSARYQLNDGGKGMPFLIANLQGILPTGRSPFKVRRDANGAAQQAATGAGFYGISPSVTAILPTDPAVLFGTLGYTFNLADTVDTRIPPVQIDKVDPGDSLSFSGGIGIALNGRTSMNLGYAHNWALGTKTWTRALDQTSGLPPGPRIATKSRDLQIGRFLFGISHRLSNRASLNWSVEVGATDDASDMRTMFRLPIIL